MRLLIIHQGYPPAGAGAEIYTAALAQALAERHEVAVLYGAAGADPPEVLKEGRDGKVRVFELPLPEKARGFEAYRDGRVAQLAGVLMDRLGPDLVHAGTLAGLSTGILGAARDRGIPVVLTLHDFWPVCPLGQLLNRRLEVCPGPSPQRCLGCVGEQVATRQAGWRALGRWLPGLAPVGRAVSRVGGAAPARIAQRMEEMSALLRAADMLVSPSRFLGDRLRDLGAPAVAHVPLGHPALPQTEPSGVRDKGQASSLTFAYLGAVIPSKGVHVLVAAFLRLQSPRPTLRIHGAAVPYHGDTGYLQRLTDRLGPEAERVLCGPFDHARVGEALADSDVVVVPSLWEENAPLVVSEAFLAHKPVIVTDHGGLREMVRHEVDGLRVPPGDAPALAAAMRRLMDEPDLYRRLAASAPRVPTMAEHVDAMERVYAQARRRFRDRVGRVGVVVLNKGRPDDTARAVASVHDAVIDPCVVVVENGPTGVSSGPWPSVLRLPRNLGFAGGVNAGLTRLQEAGCDRFLLLNNDAVVEPGCLRRLAEAFDNTHLAAIGPVVQHAHDDLLESRGVDVDLGWGRVRLLGSGERAPEGEGLRLVPALSGAVMMLSAPAMELVGPLDEEYFFSFEDVDWCLRARRLGMDVGVALGARARHTGSATIGLQQARRLYYAARNHVRVIDKLAPGSRTRCWLRRRAILAFHVAHALRQSGVPRVTALGAVVAGYRDACRGRYGPGGS